MATSLPFRSSLLQLPSHLRVAAYRQSIAASRRRIHPVRGFSHSPARRNGFTETILTPCNWVLDGLHLGLPWYAAIPMTAVLVRALFVYPFSMVPGRKRTITTTHIIPLASARLARENDSGETRAFVEKYKNDRNIIIRYAVRKFWRFNLHLHRIGKRFGAPRIHWSSPLNMVTLFAFTEAIRLKCGLGTGLFSMMMKPFSFAATEVGYLLNLQPRPSQTDLLVERLEAMRESGAFQGQYSVNAADLLNNPIPPTVDSTASTFVNPSFHTEGLSWCLDLTLPDSTYILPVFVGLSLSLNVIFRSAFRNPKISQPDNAIAEPLKPVRKSSSDLESGQDDKIPTLPTPTAVRKPLTFFEKGQLGWALLFSWISTNLPAAFLLYFISSRVMGFLYQRYLEVTMPVPKPLKPCKRPIAHRVRRGIA